MGGGQIITTEFEPSNAARAREHLTEAGLIDLVEIREGDALETLAHGLPDTLDLVLLDYLTVSILLAFAEGLTARKSELSSTLCGSTENRSFHSRCNTRP